MTTLPDALVIGPMKGGSTWIHDYLNARRDVCLPANVKETFFFDLRYDWGASWYSKHFSHYNPDVHLRIVEVAPGYFHRAESPGRVRGLLGEVPLIVTLRDPVKRAWSHYLHLRRYGYTRAPLPEAANDFPELLEASRYAACLERWQAHFGVHGFHILWQEVLAQNPEEYAASLCTSLGLRFEGIPAEAHQRKYEAAISPLPWLASFGRRVSYALRGRGLHRVVNLARRSGLYTLFFGAPGARRVPELTEDDALWLRAHLEDDFRELSRVWEPPEKLPYMSDVCG